MTERERGGLTTLLLVASWLAFGALIGGALLLMGATLASPRWLLVGAAGAVVLALDALARAWRRRCSRALGDPTAVGRLVEGRRPGVRGLRAWLAACALLLLGVACARPQWGMVEEEIARRGVDVVICVDTSRSMLARDVRPDRLTRARLEIASLLDEMEGDRIALVAFAGDARLLCPLTLDHGAVELFLQLLSPDVIDRPGTSIGPALDLAGRSFPKGDGRHAVVVLITDGEDHGGAALEAAENLASAAVIVHVVGIGKAEGSPVPLIEESGRATGGYLRDESGEVVLSRLDVETAREIARKTGGLFYQASSSDLGLAAVAAAIDRMEQKELGSRRTRMRPDRHAWPLALAFVLLLAESVVPDGAAFRRPARRLRIQRASTSLTPATRRHETRSAA